MPDVESIGNTGGGALDQSGFRRNDMLAAGLDLLDQGITLFDENLTLVAWNRAFLTMLDYPEEMAFAGASFESFVRFDAYHGEYGEGDLEALVAERLAVARRFAPHAAEHVRPNGKILQIRGEPLPQRGFITVYTDVTEQRYLQDLAEHQNLQLEERVRRHLAQLENANAEQKRMQAALIQAQKMEAIGQLTGGLAHDFNNLLTVIIGNLATLQDHLSSDSGINEYVEPALQSARRGVQLIKRLMTFSRQQPLEPQPVNIGELVGGLAKLVRRSLPESIAISTDLSAAAIRVMIDPGQLESALLNFALNARDAMPDGGQLHLAARLTNLSADAASFAVAPGQYVLFEVTDNGCGMNAETLSRVFEPLFTTKRIGLGTGLGMTMANAFARQSRGGIAIQSHPGRGTTVLMVLPHLAPASEPDHVAPEEPLRHGEDLVLLVEDDLDVRKVARNLLVGLGYPVIEAEDGVQALAMIDSIPDIRIVLSDIVMPGGVSGIQLARRVRARHPATRILLMSGYNEEVGNTAADALFILPKPFTRAELAKALQSSE